MAGKELNTQLFCLKVKKNDLSWDIRVLSDRLNCYLTNNPKGNETNDDD
jgi:hypothetical protein